MKYMGSKARIAKHILPIMLKAAEERGITHWVEPFVGGANMIDKVPSHFTRVGYDIDPHVIQALIGIRDHLDKLPSEVSEEYYKSLKNLPPDPITSWVRYECSFGSKFQAGYARNKVGSNYALMGRNLAVKQSPLISGILLWQGDYTGINIGNERCVIYCDPPYEGTTSYKGKFDHSKFWEWCREKSREGHLVFVSEYNAPQDFECIWQGEIKTNFASQRTEATHKATEKLFIFKP